MYQGKKMAKKIPPLPTFSTSTGFFCATVLGFAGLLTIYFGWYQKYIPTPSSQVKSKIITALFDDDLNVLIKNAPEGSILEIPPRTWNVNLEIIQKKNLSIIGLGEVVLASNQGVGVLIQDTEGCLIENIRFTSQSKNKPLLEVAYSRNLTIRNCELESSQLAMQVHTQTQGVILLRNTIDYEVEGLRLENCRNIEMHENQIRPLEKKDSSILSSRKAIFFLNVEGLICQKNKIEGDIAVSAEKIGGTSEQKIVFDNNQIIGNEMAFSLREGKEIRLSNNTFESTKGIALNLQSLENSEIENNHSKSEKFSALSLSGGQNLNIKENTLHNRSLSHTTLSLKTSRNINLEKNNISGFFVYQEGGIKLQESLGGGISIEDSKEIRLLENNLSESLFTGIRIEGDSHVYLQSNVISQSGGTGIEGENSFIILGPKNEIRENFAGGVLLKNCRGNITENTIERNQGFGLELERTSLDVSENKIIQNGGDGISLKNSSPNLKKNRLENNQGFGINFLQIAIIPWEEENIFSGNVRGKSNK